MQKGLAIVVRMTQAEFDAGKGTALNNKTIEIKDAAAGAPYRFDSGQAGSTPKEVVDAGNINTVLQAAGGAGWEKAQAITGAYVITRPASGASLDLHIETGGTLAAMLVANWPVPAAGVDQLRIRNMSAVAQTFTATGFSGVVTADGNVATSGSYTIPVDMAVHITIDEDGWVQVAPMGQEVSQAEFDAVVAAKRDLHALGHPFMTAETTHGHKVTASSNFNAYEPYRAMSAAPAANNEWATNSVAAATLVLETPLPIIYKKVSLKGRGVGVSVEYPRRWKIEGSNDGTTYTTILDHTGADQDLSGAAAIDYSLSYTTPYKYHRFNMTVSVGANPGLNIIRFYHTGIDFGQQDLGKVDKETGKGLSANDFTATLKTKLDGIAAGAEVNIQADWMQVATTADDFIKNKPTIPTAITVNDTLTSDSATEALSAKQGKALKTLADGKSPVAHTHAQSDVTGLPAALLAKQDTLTNAQLNALAQIGVTPTRSIPNFTANTTAGTAGNYIASANSEHSTGYFAWMACKLTQGGTPPNEWATNAVAANIWLAILFPTTRVITSARVAARATGTESPGVGWRIEASNDGITWTTLYTSLTVMPTAIETVSFVNSTAYNRYRMFSATNSGTNPGMSFFELRHDVVGFATAPTV